MKRVVPSVLLSFLLLCSLAAVSAAETPPPPDGSVGYAPPDNDPWEPFNRKVFWFNDKLDTYLIKPAAQAWDFVLPKRVQTSVSNFFDNVRFPVYTVNDLLQGKVQLAATNVGRFAVNTAIGVAGFFDPASSLGLKPHVEDFGQTLGVWGSPPGPYLVLPLLGPSTVRDGVGIGVDYPISIVPFFVPWYYTFPARSVEFVNIRASLLNTVEQAKEASFDYYVFVRNAYLQRRASDVQDQAPAAKPSAQELYYPQEGE